MNRKTKYYTRNDSKLNRLGPFDLLSLFYARDEPMARRLESLWTKYGDGILSVWREVFPATRPAVWWLLNQPEIYARLKLESIVDGWLHLAPGPEAQRAALADLGELEDGEYLAEPRAFSFKVFLEAYRRS